MRMINIGFNVQTDKAVKSLNDLEKRLEEINQYVKTLEEKHKVELDVSGVTSAVKQVKDTVAKSKDVEIISTKSIDSTIKKLLKVEEGLSHLGKNLGETSKLDVRSLMLYGKEVEKLHGDVQTLFNIFRNKDMLESFKGDDLAKLQIFVENTVKGFNKLESSVGKFNSEGLKTIETLEKQSRALEVLKKQTEAQKQIAILGNKQEQADVS